MTETQSEVSPVCLPSPGDVELPPGSPLTVAGWGARQENTGDFPDKLQEVTVELSDQASCAANYRQLVGVDIGQCHYLNYPPRLTIRMILYHSFYYDNLI